MKILDLAGFIIKCLFFLTETVLIYLLSNTLGVNVIYYRCPNCGQIYYSAATLKGDQLICDRCGATIVPITTEQFKQFIKEEKSERSKKNKGAS